MSGSDKAEDFLTVRGAWRSGSAFDLSSCRFESYDDRSTNMYFFVCNRPSKSREAETKMYQVNSVEWEVWGSGVRHRAEFSGPMKGWRRR